MKKSICRLTGLASMAFAILAMMLIAASSAFAGEPTGEYAAFRECPLSVPSLTTCVYNLTSSGEVVIGSTTAKITNPIVFQGGTSRNPLTEAETWFEAANGETLSSSPQTVSGGLLGIVAPESLPLDLGKIVNKLVSEGLAGVEATTELVGSPQYDFDNLASEKGVGLVLPVRVHLENIFLGNACYLGSASEPITLKLTTGTTSPPSPNSPITGTSGSVEIRNGGKLLVAKGASAVDNSFSVPVANGCDGLLAPIVDAAIDLKLGLPSAAGHNTAILDGNLEQASSTAVKQSGESPAEKEAREAKEREEREKREEEERRREEEEGF